VFLASKIVRNVLLAGWAISVEMGMKKEIIFIFSNV